MLAVDIIKLFEIAPDHTMLFQNFRESSRLVDAASLIQVRLFHTNMSGLSHTLVHSKPVIKYINHTIVIKTVGIQTRDIASIIIRRGLKTQC